MSSSTAMRSPYSAASKNSWRHEIGQFEELVMRASSKEPAIVPELCRNCGREATSNLQKIWVLWKYNPRTGEYSRRPVETNNIGPWEEENLHLCRPCLDLWEEGKL